MAIAGGRKTRAFVGALALALCALAVARLEGYRSGIGRAPVLAGETPGTLYALPDSDGPLVVIAHGFAGSRQLMEAFSLTLARAGYAALAFDFEGHGRNPAPMGGDVDAIDGTTALLVAETRRVIDAGLAETGRDGPVALIGHSMASDIVIRTALEDPRVGPVVAVSMFSGAVTPTRPEALLAVAGQWETRLREEGLKAARLVDADAAEGRTVRAGDVVRRAVAAPHVEHVGVLYSATTLRETLDWLDAFYGRAGTGPEIARTGGWIAALLAGIVALGWSLAGALPETGRARPVPRGTFLAATGLAAVATPLVATRIDIALLPVLVADYLAAHLLIYGAIQLVILRRAGIGVGAFAAAPMVALGVWCLGAFGLALDRYVASFVPTGARLVVMAGVALGAVPFMLADTMLTEAGRAPLWRRMTLRAAFVASIVLAVVLDAERLMFLLIILPVIVLFFAVFGLLGRGVGLRSSPLPVGLALGVILAWSLAATFPVFEP
jgi:hypothetical protein